MHINCVFVYLGLKIWKLVFHVCTTAIHTNRQQIFYFLWVSFKLHLFESLVFFTMSACRIPRQFLFSNQKSVFYIPILLQGKINDYFYKVEEKNAKHPSNIKGSSFLWCICLHKKNFFLAQFHCNCNLQSEYHTHNF